MIQIQQIRLPIDHTPEELTERIRNILKLKPDAVFSYEIARKSIDARKKPQLFYVYSVLVQLKQESSVVSRLHNPSVKLASKRRYQIPQPGERPLASRPVIVGAGPAGLFAAYQLAEAGYAPIVIERGCRVEKRTEDVRQFWENGLLKPDSNVQFGEGGAGTFSDGKLNTAVKDPSGRNEYVLRSFVRFGAPEHILYESKPHIGTDILMDVIRNMRKFLEEKGTQFLFETKLQELDVKDGRCMGIYTSAKQRYIRTDALILALGHSARDTFSMLYGNRIPMEAKSFAVGFRVEHPQDMIDRAMYGTASPGLPAAPYKVTSNFPNGRGVYSFCMCPGGYVVNASSEPGGVCVNGMSYSGRSGSNANSAIIVSVTPEDFGSADALAGMRYQQRLEQKNYQLGNGSIPQQLYGDYVRRTVSSCYGDFPSQTKGKTLFANLRGLMSEDMERSLIDGMSHFSKIIEGFDRTDAILSGMETRTSSPVRILRDERCESEVRGIYPCGEGAGYAGGIMSAAIDGLKVASAIMEQYYPAYQPE